MDTPACPACTAPGLTIVQKGELRCSYCKSTFTGIPLICPSCGWINTIEAENCPECGEPLTVVSQVFHRHDTTEGPQWRQRVQSQLGELISSEERASQLRFQELQELDKKREEAIAEQKAHRSKTDRTLLTIISIIGLLIIMGFIIIGILVR